jgi:hypothetical protein
MGLHRDVLTLARHSLAPPGTHEKKSLKKDLPDAFNPSQTLLKSLQNIAKRYFQDFWQHVFSSLLKTLRTLNFLATSLLTIFPRLLFCFRTSQPDKYSKNNF